MPERPVVSPRSRGYAGNRAARQAFFLIFLRDYAGPKTGKAASPARGLLRTNRKENNPAQIEEEETSRRAEWERVGVDADRSYFRPNQAQRFSCGPRVNDKSAFHQT